MDTFGMVALAIGALAFLQLAAANLRGPERTSQTRRSVPARR